MDFVYLAARGGGSRIVGRILRIIFMRMLFHTFGFAGGIGVLVVIAALAWILFKRWSGGRRRRSWL